MSWSIPERTYQQSLDFFKKLRAQYERREAPDIGGRPFVLVDAVSRELKATQNGEPNPLTILFHASYGRYNNQLSINKPGALQKFLPAFYTLLDLDCGHLVHRFMEHEPPLEKFPVERQTLQDMFPANGIDTYTNEPFNRLADDIYNKQWAWCALEFDWNMHSNIHHHEQIVPIIARSQIQPARDGIHNPDRKATLWVVEIPAECMGHDLKGTLFNSDQTCDDNSNETKEISKTHHLVIKQFSEDKAEQFEQEKQIFNCIRSGVGIVVCFGWYTHYEQDARSGLVRKSHNLVLERGTQDLYSAFQRENPPMTQSEIQAFWSSLFDVARALASIQKIEDERMFTIYVWHGDIKPENILDVRGRFKLADPGESCVQSVPTDSGYPRANFDPRAPKCQVPGGTRSFAAPEKNAYSPDGHRDIPYVTQGIDIWSLGCVFSVAATYVVAGKEGVKQYHLLRQQASFKSGRGVGDVFHDTEKVLREVTEWHRYLRTIVRAQDAYTSRVLDIVDKFMLITPGESRISGQVLTSTLFEIDTEAKSWNASQMQPPDEILNFLDDLMNGESQQPEIEDIPRTISQSGADMFQEGLLYRSLHSDGRSPAHGLPNGAAATTRRPITAREPFDYRIESPPFIPHALSTQRLSGTISVRPSPLELRIPTFSGPIQSPPPVIQPVTFWEIEAELEKYGKKSLIPGLRPYPSTLTRRVSVHGRPIRNKEDQLIKHFQSRDIIYLVDNSSAMARFWKHASYLLRVLVWRSLGYDDDGMELIFTNGSESLGLKPRMRKQKWYQKPGDQQPGAQKLEDFTKKMDEARPDPNGNTKTNMKASLESILGAHVKAHGDDQALKRGLTILVLTDGLWEANGEEDVDDYLTTFIKTNRSHWERSEIAPDDVNRRRPISIQFIRFGHDPKAILRLQRLDDELQHRPELADKETPDMVDTEGADGDVYKMFLGSFLEDMDNKLIRGSMSTAVLSAFSPSAYSAVDSAYNGFEGR